MHWHNLLQMRRVMMVDIYRPSWWWSVRRVMITVVQTLLTATFNSYGNSQISAPYKINTPEPIDKKNRHCWLRRAGDPYTKFGRNPSTGGFWANGCNITKKYYFFVYLYLFSQTRLTDQTCWSIFMRDSSKYVKSHKDVPFRRYKQI